MGLLEHPLEAVAFRLYSLPVPEASAATGAAAAWTCLAAAVLAAAAAAAGVWRLCLSPSPPPSAAVAAAANASGPDRSHVAEASPETSRRAPEPAAAAAATPKERYTAYYRDVGCCCCGGESDDEEGDAEERGDGDVFLSDDDGPTTDPFGWEWEVVRSLQPPLSLAAETTGRRYRRSPTTGLGGSVVQLWDQGAVRGLTPAARPRPRARVVVGTVSAF
jgi:hypothetical protein